MRIVFIGDSITRSQYRQAGIGWCEHVRENLSRFSEANGYPIESFNMGVDGSRSVEWRDWISPRVRPICPDMVVLMLGVNDCVASVDKRKQSLQVFRESMLSIVSQLSLYAGNAELLLLKPVPIGSKSYGIGNEDLAPYACFYDTLTGLSSSIHVLDTYGGIFLEEEDYVSWDGLHPSASGHKKISRIVIPAVSALVGRFYAHREPAKLRRDPNWSPIINLQF